MKINYPVISAGYQDVTVSDPRDATWRARLSGRVQGADYDANIAPARNQRNNREENEQMKV